MSVRERLLFALSNLGEDEQAVMLRIAERLLVGKEQYGALNIAKDPRNFRREAMEEILDLAAYASMRLMQLEAE